VYGGPGDSPSPGVVVPGPSVDQGPGADPGPGTDQGSGAGPTTAAPRSLPPSGFAVNR
jgi:hypothetical protein